MRRPRTRWILAAALFVAAAIQLIRPDKPGAPVSALGEMTAHIPTPRDVQVVLEEACYDCHSSDTDWPWYSQISPFSWLIVEHVRHGRTNLDFSNWSTDPQREPTPTQRLRWTCEEVRGGEMPPLSYRLLHPEARLTLEEKDLLCAWVASALERLQ